MKCCLCGKEIKSERFEDYFGNNPSPVCTIEGARCCDECNDSIVYPFRVFSITSGDQIKEIAESRRLTRDPEFLKTLKGYDKFLARNQEIINKQKGGQ